MTKTTFLPIFLLVVPIALAYDGTCPQGQITVAGANTAERQIDAWRKAYIEKCPQVEIIIQGGGYPMGAARVCGNHPVYGPVDMAAMSDTFFEPQATTDDGWNFECKRSLRKTIKLHVGHSGIRVDAAAGGSAAACIELMGGLSVDQIRWIYSSFAIKELKGFKWDINSVPFSDGDDSTHLWSELHENCTAQEILAAGPADEDSIASTFLHQHVLTGGFETARDYHRVESIAEMDEYLEAYPNAIAFLQFYNILSTEFTDRVDKIYPVPIMDSSSGEYIKPSTESFETHDYPLLRRVDLGIVNDPNSLAVMRPFLEFSLSPKGDEVIKQEGFWPIRIWEKITMHSRIGSSLGQDVDEIKKWCGPPGGSIHIAGSPYVRDVALVWSQVYNLACPTSVTLEAGGSCVGASRLCAKDADIALMTRDWKDEEAASARDDFLYTCLISQSQSQETTTSAIQVDVAHDGLTVVVAKDGAAERCTQLIGGLTKDQLRWIYSGYSEEELKAAGWDSASLKGDDGNPKTHLWSELDPRCDPEEIRIAGNFLDGDGFASFSESILLHFKDGEYVALNRTHGYFADVDLELLVYVLKYKAAISYVSFHYYDENKDLFSAVPIENDLGAFVLPSEESISDGSYPLVRSLTMNLLNNKDSLSNTIPLLKFGYTHPDLLMNTGYVPLTGNALETMFRRLDGAPYPVAGWVGEDEDDEKSFNSLGVISAFVGAGLVLLCVSSLIWCWCESSKESK